MTDHARSTGIAATLVASTLTCVAAAGLKVYDPAGVDHAWGNDSNWFTFGVPSAGDDVIAAIGQTLLLDESTASLDSLSLSGGIAMSTYGRQLIVGGTADSLISLSGQNTVLQVSPLQVAGQYAIETGRLSIEDGAALHHSGGFVRIGSNMEAALFIGEDGVLEGHGTHLLFGSSSRKLVNNGRIRVHSGDMALSGLGSGAVDLDGSVAGRIEVAEGRRLTVEAELSDNFDGVMNIERDADVYINADWELGPFGTIEFDAAGGVATLSSDDFSGRGDLIVLGGTARLINSTYEMKGGSWTELAEGTRLEVEETLILDGTIKIAVADAGPLVDVTETAILDGPLEVELASEYTVGGQGVVLFAADVIDGVFTEHTVPAGLQVTYEPNRVILDRAIPCVADVNNDGHVTVSDLQEVLLNWGVTGETPADIDGNGQVDVPDLVAVIVAWGVCN